MTDKILPDQFRARYTAGAVLLLVPVLSVVLAYFVVINSRFVWLFAAKYVLALLFFTWHSNRLARRQEAWFVETRKSVPDLPITILANQPLWGELIIITVSALTVGGLYAWAKQDARWVIVAIALALLLGIGATLRWYIYDRWLARME